MSKIALLDLDGTLADYDAAMKRDMELIRSPHEPIDDAPHVAEASYMKARAKMIRSQPNWWLNLEPIKSGFDVVGKLKEYGFELHILTKAPHSVDAAWTEKVKWVKKYLPDTDITISQQKGLVYGKVLLDDWPEYINDWLAYRPRGLVIMPVRRWNVDFHHPTADHQIVRYDGNNIDEVGTRIKEIIAYNK